MRVARRLLLRALNNRIGKIKASEITFISSYSLRLEICNTLEILNAQSSKLKL